METNFHLSVDINIGLTPQLQNVLESLKGIDFTFGMKDVTPTPVAEDPVAEPVEETEPAPTKKTSKKSKPIAVTEEEQQEEFEEMKKENPAIEELQNRFDLELETKEPAEIVREIIKGCRDRIEGEGWNKESKYHRELSIELKSIARLLGSDRPSELPAEQIPEFARMANDLIVKDGKIITEAPF